MTEIPANLRDVDWSQTSFAGARREQLREWSRMPLAQVIESLESMSRLQQRLSGSSNEYPGNVLRTD